MRVDDSRTSGARYTESPSFPCVTHADQSVSTPALPSREGVGGGPHVLESAGAGLRRDGHTEVANAQEPLRTSESSASISTIQLKNQDKHEDKQDEEEQQLQQQQDEDKGEGRRGAGRAPLP